MADRSDRREVDRARAIDIARMANRLIGAQCTESGQDCQSEIAIATRRRIVRRVDVDRDPSPWCPRPDSNRHGLPHHPLKMACLPIPPLRHVRRGMSYC